MNAGFCVPDCSRCSKQQHTREKEEEDEEEEEEEDAEVDGVGQKR